MVYGSWPPRVLEHRGWTHVRCFFTRVATAEEVEAMRTSPRYLAYRYKTAKGLLEDEAEFMSGNDLATLARAIERVACD